ncbi:MAG: DUF3362 domain-containing protein, partial [Paludibacter sp.]|nr:DUF3362 domain-containing protein [Paludibacter sp.]
YVEELVARHVSGRLKVAPEHTVDKVLKIMRKPSFTLFEKFTKTFDNICQKHSINQQIIPYFIAGHPACTAVDMAELAVKTKTMNFRLEQVQNFTPTPMTLASTMFYTGIDPYSMEKIYSAHTKSEKDEQQQFFFWYKPELRPAIEKSLRKEKRVDLLHLLTKRY